MTVLFYLAAAAFALRMRGDAAFLAALRARDPAAVRELVDRHHAALVGLARTVVRRRELAEEVAQETWIAVLDGISGFDGRSALSSWIVAILLNKAKTLARREGRYVPFAEEDAGAGGPAVDPARFTADGHWSDPPAALDGLDPERILAGRELWRHVREEIEGLPPAQRAVLLLRDVEGRDAAETCRLLELTPENQRVLLHRGRARLRNRLEELLRAGRHAALAQA